MSYFLGKIIIIKIIIKISSAAVVISTVALFLNCGVLSEATSGMSNANAKIHRGFCYFAQLHIA